MQRHIQKCTDDFRVNGAGHHIVSIDPIHTYLKKSDGSLSVADSQWHACQVHRKCILEAQRPVHERILDYILKPLVRQHERVLSNEFLSFPSRSVCAWAPRRGSRFREPALARLLLTCRGPRPVGDLVVHLTPVWLNKRCVDSI